MSISKSDQRKLYPLPAYNYRVSIGSETVAFSQVSGLSKSYDHAVYKHGFSDFEGYHFIKGQSLPVNISLNKGITKSNGSFYQWVSSREKKDILIDLCDESGNAVVRWKILGALPLTYSLPNFSAEVNEVAIEQIEMIAQDIQTEYLS